MILSNIPVPVMVFLASWLAAPLIYSLDKLATMEDQRWIFVAGVIVLPLFGLMSSVFARDSKAKQEPLFYVWAIFAFTAIVDLFIGLELEGFVKGFMEFYLREGEPYLRSAYGNAINWWDGIGHFSMYIIMIALASYGRDFRMVGLYWVGSIAHSMIVFMPGNMTGNKGLRWSYLLNVPYVFVPFFAGVRFIREGMRVKHKNQLRVKTPSLMDLATNLLFLVLFICATAVAGFRMISVLGCKTPIAVYYAKNIDPYLMDPGQYGKMQALLYFYYFIPFYIAAICSLLFANQHWIKDWSIIHAGASTQAQLVYITCSFHWRTEAEFRVPDDFMARAIFLTINVSLWVVPHLFAAYCNWEGLTTFLEEEVVPRLKYLTGEKTLIDINSDGELSPSRIPTRKQGPVTRMQKKLE